MTVMSGRVELVDAVRAGDLERVVRLVRQGHSVDESDKNGTTALAWASSLGHKEIAQFLIKNGCDVNSQNSCNATPLQAAADNGRESCVELLLQNGADLDARSERGDTVLHMAAFRGHLDILRLLTHSGANPFIRNSANLTAAHEAMSQRHLECERHLREYSDQQKGFSKYVSLHGSQAETYNGPPSVERHYASWPCEVPSYTLSPQPSCPSRSTLSTAQKPSSPLSVDAANAPAPALPPRLPVKASQSDKSLRHAQVRRLGFTEAAVVRLSSSSSTSPVNEYKWGRPTKVFDGSNNFQATHEVDNGRSHKFTPNIPVENEAPQPPSSINFEHDSNGHAAQAVRVPTEESALPLERTCAPPTLKSEAQKNLQSVLNSNQDAQLRLPSMTQMPVHNETHFESIIVAPQCQTSVSGDWSQSQIHDGTFAETSSGTDNPHALFWSNGATKAADNVAPGSGVRVTALHNSSTPEHHQILFANHLQRNLVEMREKLRSTETELADMRYRLGVAETSNLRLQQELSLSKMENSELKSEVLKLRGLVLSLTHGGNGRGGGGQGEQAMADTRTMSGRLPQISEDSQLHARGSDSI